MSYIPCVDYCSHEITMKVSGDNYKLSFFLSQSRLPPGPTVY